MRKHFITAAGIGLVALLAIGVVVSSPFPAFVDAVKRDYSAFMSGAGSDDVHKIGRDLERLQPHE